MGFYLVNDDLNQQLSDIKRSIKLSMNGVVADAMSSQGVSYKQNFGVELPVLRSIAQGFAPNEDLANRLWMLGWRETRIISLLLEPVEKFDASKAIQRITEAPQIELIQLMAIYLLPKVNCADELCLLLLEQENLNCKIASYLTVVQLYAQLSEPEIQTIIIRAIKDCEFAEFQLINSISKCFSRLCRLGKPMQEIILSAISGFENSTNVLKAKLYAEISQELEYLQ